MKFRITSFGRIRLLYLEEMGERYVGELEGAKGQSDVDTDLAHGSIVFDVVCMEGTKCTLF
jgi:hypothetical protein